MAPTSLTQEITAAMSTGTEPPWVNFSTFAPRKPRPTTRKRTSRPASYQRGQLQRVRATTENMIEVMAMVPHTAMP